MYEFFISKKHEDISISSNINIKKIKLYDKYVIIVYFSGYFKNGETIAEWTKEISKVFFDGHKPFVSVYECL